MVLVDNRLALHLDYLYSLDSPHGCIRISVVCWLRALHVYTPRHGYGGVSGSLFQWFEKPLDFHRLILHSQHVRVPLLHGFCQHLLIFHLRVCFACWSRVSQAGLFCLSSAGALRYTHSMRFWGWKRTSAHAGHWATSPLFSWQPFWLG